MRTTSKSYQELFPPRINDFYKIPLSSVCNAKCKFCFERNNPFEVKKVGFRPTKEIFEHIDSIENINQFILLGGTVSGRGGKLFGGRTEQIISWGEQLIHPDIFSIIEYIRKRFNNPISVYTNGTTLTREFIEKLSKFKPFNIGLSFSTIDRETWKYTNGLDDKHFDIVINSLKYLREYGINIMPSMVMMPQLSGFDSIERTIEFFKNYDVDTITVFAPCYTRYTDPEALDNLMKIDETELLHFLERMEEKYGITFRWSLNPKIDLDVDHDKIRKTINDLYKGNVKNTYWLTSISAYDRFVDIINNINTKKDFITNVLKVNNGVFGGNVKCCGLWMIEDVRQTLLENSVSESHILLPGIFLDDDGYDMMGENIMDLINSDTKNSYTIIN